jgi:hypothetical protein
MTCKERTHFLRTHLIPEGFRILFPKLVLTAVVHNDWADLNRHMRKELESIRG